MIPTNSNQLSNFTALVVVAFTIKEKDTASSANTQAFSKYFNVRMRFILIIVFRLCDVLWGVSRNQ